MRSVKPNVFSSHSSKMEWSTVVSNAADRSSHNMFIVNSGGNVAEHLKECSL